MRSARMADLAQGHGAWGNPYSFTVTDRQVTLWSHGADGQQGGEGRDADIVHTFDVDRPSP